MKTITFKMLIALFSVLFLVVNCAPKDDTIPKETNTEEKPSENPDGIAEYKGDVGVLIDVRPLFKKGYNPTKVVISTQAVEGNYNHELTVDSVTSFARLAIPVDSLTPKALAELKQGVKTDITVLEGGKKLTELLNREVVFKENGTLIMVDASKLAYKNVELNFKEDMFYYMQLLYTNGKPTDKNASLGWTTEDGLSYLKTFDAVFDSNSKSQHFKIFKDPNDKGYFLITNSYGNYLQITSDIDFQQTLFAESSKKYPYGINDGNSLAAKYKFKIEKYTNGLYVIKGFDKSTSKWLPLRKYNSDIFTTEGSGDVYYFRFVAVNANWKAEEIATKHLQPILPAVETSFAFNNTLVNCGKGDLEQEVGIEKSITTKNTSGYKENIGISSSKTTSVGLKVGAKTQVGFFAAKVDISAEISTSLELTTKATQSTTQSKEFSESVTNKYFAKRTVNIPPKSASLVSDAYQTYSKVELPFVQTLRLRADHVNPNTNAVIGAMTGKEIVTQLVFSNFSGYVIAVGDYYADITLRGKTTLDNLVDTKSEVKDVVPNCE